MGCSCESDCHASDVGGASEGAKEKAVSAVQQDAPGFHSDLSLRGLSGPFQDLLYLKKIPIDYMFIPIVYLQRQSLLSANCTISQWPQRADLEDENHRFEGVGAGEPPH